MTTKTYYKPVQPVVVTLNGLVDGGIADSTVFDNTTENALSYIVHAQVSGSNALETGYVVVSVKEGLTSALVEDNRNTTDISIIILNGTTHVNKILHYNYPVAPFFKLSFKLFSSNLYPLSAASNSANITSQLIASF